MSDRQAESTSGLQDTLPSVAANANTLSWNSGACNEISTSSDRTNVVIKVETSVINLSEQTEHFSHENSNENILNQIEIKKDLRNKTGKTIKDSCRSNSKSVGKTTDLVLQNKIDPQKTTGGSGYKNSKKRKKSRSAKKKNTDMSERMRDIESTISRKRNEYDIEMQKTTDEPHAGDSLEDANDRKLITVDTKENGVDSSVTRDRKTNSAKSKLLIKCEECKSRFKSQIAYENHKKKDMCKQQCESCGKVFDQANRQGYMFHLRCHKKKRKDFQCQDCNKIFIRKSHLGTRKRTIPEINLSVVTDAISALSQILFCTCTDWECMM